MMFSFAQAKMMEVLFCEYEGRPIRINEVISSADIKGPYWGEAE